MGVPAHRPEQARETIWLRNEGLAMLGAAFLVVIAIAILLVPDLRADVGTWILSGVLLVIAVLYVVVSPPRRTILTARQYKFSEWWGFTSHDGSGERDVREKRGE